MASIRQSEAISQSDVIGNICDTGGTATIVCYGGTPPADVEVAVTGAEPILAILTASADSFAAGAAQAEVTGPPFIPKGATITANAITADPSADATGTCTFVRVIDGGGMSRIQLTPVVSQAEVVATPSIAREVVFNNKDLQLNTEVQMTALTYTQPMR